MKNPVAGMVVCFVINGALQDAVVVRIGRDSPDLAMGGNHSPVCNPRNDPHGSLRALLSSTSSSLEGGA
jgi:hypothetical protein